MQLGHRHGWHGTFVLYFSLRTSTCFQRFLFVSPPAHTKISEFFEKNCFLELWMLLWVRRIPHAVRSGGFRLSPGEVKSSRLRRVMGTNMEAWMPLPSPWCLILITRRKRVASTSSDDNGSFGSTSSTHYLGTVSVFVTSSTTYFIQTEQWLHYYDIFMRIGSGSYLRVMREVIFSPVMGDWLFHRDSSSVEYNAGSPTKTSSTKSRSFLFWV